MLNKLWEQHKNFCQEAKFPDSHGRLRTSTSALEILLHTNPRILILTPNYLPLRRWWSFFGST